MKFLSLLLSFVMFVSTLSAQVPSAQIKIAQKSGFLGMGGPRFIELRMSNETNQLPLTDENVNAGGFYYFLSKPIGDWLFDSDFVEEELLKLSLMQGEQKFVVGWKAEFKEEDSTLLIGFTKQLRLDQPIRIEFLEADTPYVAEMRIPLGLWPGASGMREVESQAASAIAGGQYKNAIALYERILSERSYSIFPSYSSYGEKRTSAFSTFFNIHWNSVATAVKDAQLELKSKIAVIDSIGPNFEFVQDSLLNPTLGITNETPGVGPIFTNARNAIAWSKTKRDSLQVALDDQNVRWIYNGSVAGRAGFQYQTILETIAYAFSSLDFTDTLSTVLVFTISEEQRANLAKNDLIDSYETFLRLTNDRHKQSLSLFPSDFLSNVQNDTAAFHLPFYSMLKAVDDYFGLRFDKALKEIFRIFKVSYDTEVSARYDQMRIMIQVRRGEFRPEAVRLLQEAATLETANPDEAGEKYRQATVLAPGFAYASFSLGKYYTRLNDPIRAQTFFERAYQTDTLYLSAYREAFNLFRRVGNYKPMIGVLSSAIARGSDYWETHSNLGLAYMGDGDPARAIQQYELALGINPRSYTTNIQLGLAYQTVKNYQKAREYFNNAINIDPLRQEAVEYLSRLNELQRSGK
jgi:tetratricopeptide (TPR) repeat protein